MIFVNDVDDKDFLTELFNAMYDELPRRNQKRKNYMGEIKMSSKKRFEVIHSEGGFRGVVEILVDKETGVNYLFRASGYAGGLTPLLDREGKPVVSPVLQEE